MKKLWLVSTAVAVLAWAAVPVSAGTGLKRLQQRVAALEGAMPNLSGAMNDINTLQSQVENLTSQLTTMGNRVDNLESQLAEADLGAAANLEGRVLGLESTVYDCMFATGVSQFADYVVQDAFGDLWLGTGIDFDNASPDVWAVSIDDYCVTSSKSQPSGKAFKIESDPGSGKVRRGDRRPLQSHHP